MNAIFALKKNWNFSNVNNVFLFPVHNVLINFISIMKNQSVQCVDYVNYILLVKKALIWLLYQVKNINNYVHASKPCFVACSSDFHASEHDILAI